MSIDITGADEYFKAGNHPSSALWAGFSAIKDRESAVLYARRILSRAIERALDDNEPAYQEGDTLRDEYAVYEQALHILRNSVMPNKQKSAPKWMGTKADEPDHIAHPDPTSLSHESLRWLGVGTAHVILSRG